MRKLIIKDENENVTNYDLKDYRIIVTEREVTLELSSNDDITIEYHIRTDMRVPDIKSIITFVLKYLTGDKLYIREDLTRSYIFIGEDENIIQFTATKN